MKIIKIFLLILCFLLSQASHSVANDFWIRSDAYVTGAYTVVVEIETNIPDSSILSANIGLKGLNPEGVFIGTNYSEVPVVNSQAKVIIDGANRPFPKGSKLPTGDYDVSVVFFPSLPENQDIAWEAKINDSIRALSSVFLEASGKSSDDAKRAAEALGWAKANLYYGCPWEPTFWRNKYGGFEQADCSTKNPEVLKVYYIKSIDMSLLVDVVKEEILEYRTGLQCKP